MEQLIKRTLCLLFLAALFFVCCNKNAKVEKEDLPDFYELCFYFSKLPAKASLKDVETASKTFAATLSANVLSERATLLKSCFFLDKEPDLSADMSANTPNEVANYLLKAFFKKESASLYGIKNSGKIIKKIFDEARLSGKLNAAEDFEEGISFKGWNTKIPYLSRYLENIGIKHSFGSSNGIALNIPADPQGRWKIALFLYNSLDLANLVKPIPGDFAVLAQCGEEDTVVNVKKHGWNKTKVEKTASGNGKNSILFKLGASNIPFSDEIALKYLHSLALSHELPFESGSFYAPNFVSSSVVPVLYLFSGELLFSAPAADPESLLLWTVSSERQLETYPDALYANLMALKIARKLVFADKTFLGGKDLENEKQFVDFEAVRNSFFSDGNVSVSGEMPEEIYLFSGETIKESVTVADISEVSGFKALFGDPEINDAAIVTFVLRGKNVSGIIDRIEKSLEDKGFEPFLRIEENIGEADAWGSVSVKTAISNERKLMDLYDKEYKNFDKTLSIGVYRVSEK